MKHVFAALAAGIVLLVSLTACSAGGDYESQVRNAAKAAGVSLDGVDLQAAGESMCKLADTAESSADLIGIDAATAFYGAARAAGLERGYIDAVAGAAFTSICPEHKDLIR